VLCGCQLLRLSCRLVRVTVLSQCAPGTNARQNESHHRMLKLLRESSDFHGRSSFWYQMGPAHPRRLIPNAAPDALKSLAFLGTEMRHPSCLRFADAATRGFECL